MPGTGTCWGLVSSQNETLWFVSWCREIVQFCKVIPKYITRQSVSEGETKVAGLSDFCHPGTGIPHLYFGYIPIITLWVISVLKDQPTAGKSNWVTSGAGASCGENLPSFLGAPLALRCKAGPFPTLERRLATHFFRVRRKWQPSGTIRSTEVWKAIWAAASTVWRRGNDFATETLGLL